MYNNIHFFRKHLLMALMKDDFPIFGVPNIIILIPYKFIACCIHIKFYTLTVFGTLPPARSTIQGNI